MNKEHDEALCRDFPEIFRDRLADMRTTAMYWGFECGDGWEWLIRYLCKRVQSYLDLNPHLKVPQVVATQVKEKYGTLRFYFTGGNEYIEGMVSFAEHLSGYICEKCGSTEHVGHTQGWISTLCRKCAEGNDNWVEDEE